MLARSTSAAPRIFSDVDLHDLNSFGLPGRAARLALIEEAAQVAALAGQSGWSEVPHLVLGGGSNIILRGDFAGLVLKVAIPGRACVDEDRTAWYVRAGAGESWPDFVAWTLAQGWPGLENLSLIPGTVGAAPIQNIGAYGVELDARLHSLEAVSLEDGRPRRFDVRDGRFGYRDSVFKHAAAGKWLITAVTFRLPKQWQPITAYAELARELARSGIGSPTPHDIAAAVITIRQRKLPDPAVLGNAGSFFKNPLVDTHTLQRLRDRYPDLPCHVQPDGGFKLAAGWLIDRCGWKGRNLGPVGCFERQALVLVNRGGARGADVERLADAIRDDVAARFAIHLETEPVFV